MRRRARARSPELTAARRKRLARSSFALPPNRDTPKGVKGRYPIDTLGRARNALTRVAQHGSPAEKTAVRRAVHRKWPSIEVSGLRKRRR